MSEVVKTDIYVQLSSSNLRVLAKRLASASVSAVNDSYIRFLFSSNLLSDPEMKKKLISGKNTPLEECIPEDEVEW